MGAIPARVEIISKELITPSNPTPLESKHLKPSFLDQISPPCYIPLVFFYQNELSTSKTFDSLERSRVLKQSMSETLSKFFPLAGKVNRDLSVDCDDSGALFLEAKVHAPFSEALQNAPLPKLNQFLPFHPFEMDSEKLFDAFAREEILLAAQISRFECGSYAIGLCFSHAVGDVMCLVSFMQSWASASLGENSNPNPLVLEPNFDLGRRLFPALDPGLFPVSDDSGDSDPNVPVVKVKNVSKRLLFDKEKIAELKELAMASSPMAKDPTRVEVVTAFIWKHLIKLARAKNEVAKTMFIARHAVNVRSRMNLLASEGEFAFGNFTIVTSASFLSSEDNEEKEYHELVLLTSTGLREINEEFVIKNVQSDPVAYLNSMNATGVEEKVMLNDCYFTSWNRFPVYEVDFGWGNPVLVTPAGVPAGGGVVVLMGTRSGDGIEAWVGLREDEIALLDAEFVSLATSEIFPAN